MSKDTYWFRHDSNARNDVRLVKLRRVAGLEGVGLFWCLIEMLREAKSYELPLTSIDDIAYDLRVDNSVFDAIFESELLTKGDSFFFSNSLLNRMTEYDKVKEKRRLAGAKGGKAKASKFVASDSKFVAIAKQSSSKSVAEVKQSLANRVELNRVELNVIDNNIEDNTNTPNPSKGNIDFSDFEFHPALKESLEDYRDHIKALGKSHKKTERAWVIFKSKVRAILDNHGEQVTQQQVLSAIEGNWKTIYEPKININTASKPQELVNGGYGDWSNL